eukprot:s176_g3.t1
MTDVEINDEDEARSTPLPANIDADVVTTPDVTPDDTPSVGDGDPPGWPLDDNVAELVDTARDQMQNETTWNEQNFEGDTATDVPLPADESNNDQEPFEAFSSVEWVVPTSSDLGSWENMEQEPEKRESGDTATAEQLAAFDRIVDQAKLSVELSDNLTLPWEQGVFRAIFSDEPLTPLPQVPKVTQSIDRRAGETPELEPEDIQPKSKMARFSSTIHRHFDRAICFGMTMTDSDLLQTKWARALEKIFTIFTSCPGACPAGLTLNEQDMEGNFEKIRHLCGFRSPNTVLKRADSLLKYIRWHRSFYYHRDPMPFKTDEISEYIWEKFQDKVSYSTLSSFAESVNFGVHVLGMKAAQQLLINQFSKGIIDQAAAKRPGRKQARPLTVKEIMFLEGCLRDSGLDVRDRFAAGVFLFAVYARCRWSDLRSVNDFELDMSMEEGRVDGFVSPSITRQRLRLHDTGSRCP